VQSRTTAAEGHPVCTSEVLGARKIGEEAAKVAWPRSLTARGIHPRIGLSHERARGGLSRPLGPERSAARKHSVAWMANVPKKLQLTIYA